MIHRAHDSGAGLQACAGRPRPAILLTAVALIASTVFLIAQEPPAGAPAAQAKGKGGRGPSYRPPEGPAPVTAWGKPDISGIWQRPYVPDIERAIGQGPLPYTEWGKQQFDSYKPEQDGDYTGSCLPFGHSRGINGPDPIQFVQTPTTLALLYEQNTWFKVMPLDGRARKKKVPTWFGDSIGHWEGDTLVVETTNFNGLTRLDTNGHPHSDQLTMLEKFTRIDLGHLAYEVTITDPKTYTKPLTMKRTFTLRPDWEIQEYSCEENNKGVVEGRIKVPNYDNKK